MASNKVHKNENGAVQMRAPVLKLRPLDGQNQSSLLLRRSRKSFQTFDPIRISSRPSSDITQHDTKFCAQCRKKFDPNEEMIQQDGQLWHGGCFVCAQCFQPFPDGIFYEFEGRRYCDSDFKVLFAPACGKCKEFVVGRVIKAMGGSWHPECFTCHLCHCQLSDAGFIKSAGRPICRDCNKKEKALGLGKYVCFKCHSIIEDGPLKYKGETYHSYHFNCTECKAELKTNWREVDGNLFCLRCFDRTKVPICAACRHPIEGRIVEALGKTWHAEHFVCVTCEKPFHSSRHYEKENKAYCELHYFQLLGNTCFRCNFVIVGDAVEALGKVWCPDHFACSFCDQKLSKNTKFNNFDNRPMCKRCYKKLPSELTKRLEKENKRLEKETKRLEKENKRQDK